MKVVVWNMAHRVASWKVLEEMDPDVALLSEARVPKKFAKRVLGGEKTEGRDGYKRPWAAAVMSRTKPQEIQDAHSSRRGRAVKVPFENSRPGSWVAAVASAPGVETVTAVALYGLMDEKSDASVHRSLSELTPLFEDSRYNRHLLLGGDLNTWTGWEADSQGLARDQAVLDRIRAFGLVDCLAAKRQAGRLKDCPCSFGDDCIHSRTRLDSRYPTVPYQMDYLFASPALAERPMTCKALTHEEQPSPSDHYPIVATFEI